MKDIFAAIRETVPLREAARRFGLVADRAGMVRCPFHEDHIPSLRLYDDHFYCFGCHAHGDAVDLVVRLTGCRPIEAARVLAEEFSLPV